MEHLGNGLGIGFQAIASRLIGEYVRVINKTIDYRLTYLTRSLKAFAI